MYIIVLSNEGDLLKRTGQWSYGATFNKDKATKFTSQEEARTVMTNLGVRMLWNEVYVDKL